ncbi:2-phytyl-1,4-beta-naphthoquinone methyltransferase, chloroplastic isoform X2 [Carica papaya]|uniref:2-phytyl-1,4-beta-naphthoquinone methyltransferase, chloroplastic isoform X2 n=1 Tax=Carica papaya TaxID=3649 RepID=UPI000B8CB45F|nr:2-phytyl-1,4-beta-naphthoquinone methyltransferase, chloroplastic isoform X2 [Carica papaya]
MAQFILTSFIKAIPASLVHWFCYQQKLPGMASMPLFLGSPSAPYQLHSGSRKLPVRCADERQALFSRIAPVYDNHRIWKRMAVSWSGAKMGDRVLDLCCGSGDLTFLLSRKVGPDGKVSGLDFSGEQLAIASSRQLLLPKPCNENIEWIEGDALNLPFSDGYFDAITMGYGLRNVIDRPKAMGEMFRVLKLGSKVSILDFNKSNEQFTTSVQDWMIDNVVVPVAALYGLSKEYEYLKTSIKSFLTGKELEELALEAGFSDARHFVIGGGLMGNLVATR